MERKKYGGAGRPDGRQSDGLWELRERREQETREWARAGAFVRARGLVAFRLKVSDANMVQAAINQIEVNCGILFQDPWVVGNEPLRTAENRLAADDGSMYITLFIEEMFLESMNEVMFDADNDVTWVDQGDEATCWKRHRSLWPQRSFWH